MVHPSTSSAFHSPTFHRSLRLLALSSLLACVDNPYIIGELRDYRDLDPTCLAHPDALICSSFEQDNLLDWPDPTRYGNAEIERSEEQAYSGTGSLHGISHGQQSTAVVTQTFTPLLWGDLFLQAQLYVPAGPPTQTMNLFFIGFDPNPTPNAFVGLDLNLEADAIQVYSPHNTPARITGDVTIPRDRWFCLQLHLVIGNAQESAAGNPGAVQVHLDGALALDATAYDTLPDEGVSRVRVGIDWSSNQDASFEVFIDDLVVGRIPTKCEES